MLNHPLAIKILRIHLNCWRYILIGSLPICILALYNTIGGIDHLLSLLLWLSLLLTYYYCFRLYLDCALFRVIYEEIDQNERENGIQDVTETERYNVLIAEPLIILDTVLALLWSRASIKLNKPISQRSLISRWQGARQLLHGALFGMGSGWVIFLISLLLR